MAESCQAQKIRAQKPEVLLYNYVEAHRNPSLVHYFS